MVGGFPVSQSIILPKAFIAQKTKENTRRSYSSSLQRWLRFVTETEGDDLDAMASLYFSKSPDYQGDLERFMAYLRELGAGHQTGTASTYRQVVQNYLADSGLFVDAAHKRRLRKLTPGSQALTVKKIPTPSQLRIVLIRASPELRLFAMIAKSSGGRPAEIYTLTPSDIDRGSVPNVITFREETTKGRKERFSFIDSETLPLLNDWLLVNHAHGLWDSAFKTIMKHWEEAVEREGFGEKDPHTHKLLFHFYVLRKYFRTNLRAGGMSRDYVELLMGHVVKGWDLDEVYTGYLPRQIAPEYLKAESALSTVVTPSLPTL
jgi:integrase